MSTNEQKMKTAVMNFTDDLNLLTIESGSWKGEYVPVKKWGCKGCSFFAPGTLETCALGGHKHARCGNGQRPDKAEIVWVKRVQEEEIKPTPLHHNEWIAKKRHPRAHAELIKQWASDFSLKVYVWNNNSWMQILEPTWVACNIYAVGEEMPTSPPTQSYEITIHPNRVHVELLEVDELSTTVRGKGGFGSTGT